MVFARVGSAVDPLRWLLARLRRSINAVAFDGCQVTPYIASVIETFKNKALKRYWTRGDEAGVRPDWRSKVRLILSRLDAARSPSDMDVVGFGFHALTGEKAGRFAVLVSRNWRITFAWTDENAVDVDLEDYHGD